MEVKKLVAVNWGLLAPREFVFSQANLLSGANGAGKTTLMDAMQSVMSGTLHGVLSFNRAQGEASQTARDGKDKRTVATYIVGQDEGTRRHSRGATGYLAMVFVPSAGEAVKPFSAIMGGRVEISGDTPKLDCLRLWLVEGEVALSDFCEMTQGGYDVPAIDQMNSRLRATYGTDQVARFDDGKKEYLTHLYARLQGSHVPLPVDEALRAGRTWCSLIGLKGELGNIHQLVRDQLLTAPDMSEELGRIKDILQGMRGLRQDFDRLNADLQSLEGLEKGVQAELIAVANLMRAHLGEQETTILQQNKLIGILKEEREDRVVDLTNAQTARAEAEIELVARTQDAQAAEDTYRRASEENGEARLVERLTQVDAVLKAMQQSLNKAANTFSTAGVLSQVDAAPVPALKSIWRDLTSAASRCAEALGRWTADTLSAPDDWLEAAGEMQALLRSGEGLSEVQAMQFSANGDLAEINKQLTTQKEELEHARMDTGGLPREVQRLKLAIEAKFPTACPRIVAEVAEVLDPEWQPAIEALLGKSCYAILVSERDETAVARYVTDELGADYPVIQGTKLSRRNVDVKNGSLMDEVAADDPIIEKFLANKLGRVMKARSVEDLKHMDQAITRDGFRVGGDAYHKRFNLNHAPIFGAHAGAARVADLMAKIEVLESKKRGVQEKATAAKQAIQLLGPMAQNDLPVVEGYADELIQRARIVDELDAARSQNLLAGLLAARDTTASAKEAAHQALRRHDIDLGRAQSEVGVLDNRLSGVEAKLKELVEALEHNRIQWMTALDKSPVFDPLEWVEQKPKGEGWDVAAGERVLAAAHAKLDHALRDYNARAATLLVTPVQVGEPGLGDLPRLVAITDVLADRLARLRDIDIIEAARRLNESESSFNSTFTATFCDRVLSQVEGCKRELDAMNVSLKKLVCMGESFTIEWVKDPVQAPYLSLFEALRMINDAKQVGSLFEAAGLTDEHRALVGKIMALLLSADDVAAERELKLLADARNYYRYDIIRRTATGHTDRLSTWGTGSGGQLATPVTVLRAAVLASAVKLFDSRKASHLRMLAMDEAFDKLDGPRTQALMSFLAEQLGLQVFCAMPTKDVPMIRSSFDLEYEFLKSSFDAGGTVRKHTDVRFTQYKRARVRELEAQHVEQVSESARVQFRKVA